jgi:hypothetical protein
VSTGQEEPQEDDPQEEDQPGQARAEVSAPRRPRHRKGNTSAMAVVLADGGTQEAAAKAGGISVREVRRRQHEPDVKAIVREINRERRRCAGARLAEGFLEAIETMSALQGPEQPPDLRLKAAKEMLNAGFRNLEHVEDEERFEELEAKARDDSDSDEDSEW